jgi:hypothetical protein
MKYDPTPLNEILFKDRRYVTLLFEALDTHPAYAGGNHTKVILRWKEAGIAVTESAHLVDWFCTTHPMRARRIERNLKLKMRKQGWRV